MPLTALPTAIRKTSILKSSVGPQTPANKSLVNTRRLKQNIKKSLRSCINDFRNLKMDARNVKVAMAPPYLLWTLTYPFD